MTTFAKICTMADLAACRIIIESCTVSGYWSKIAGSPIYLIVLEWHHALLLVALPAVIFNRMASLALENIQLGIKPVT